MSEKNKFLIPIGVSLVFILGLIGGYVFHPDVPAGRSQKLEEILSLLDKNYVDTINKEEVFIGSIQEMLHQLDPHSRYITRESLAQENESINGSFGGIGVRFQLIRDTICITHVIDNAPARTSGVLSGDKIVAINGKSFVGKTVTNEKIMKNLKGEMGTQVSVTLYRNHSKKEVTITRDQIPVATILAAYMIQPNTGFIKIEQFSVPTADEFHIAAQKLVGQGMTKLILDLRGNPGGVLECATKIADEFIKPGKTILTTKGKNVGTEVIKSTDFGILENMELVVLIDQGSASASEILAGALQDNDRGTILGRRSYGKGLVQQDKILADGSSVRMTIARYYTPSGRCIQREYNGDYQAYLRDEERYEKGALFHEETQKNDPKQRFKTVKGKTVYGGGGISPDVFIPLDTAFNYFYYQNYNVNEAISSFGFDYLQNNRKKWNKISDLKRLEINAQMMLQFQAYAKKNNQMNMDAAAWLKFSPHLKHRIKEEIARQLFQEEGYYEVANEYDQEVQKALKIR